MWKCEFVISICMCWLKGIILMVLCVCVCYCVFTLLIDKKAVYLYEMCVSVCG